MSDEIQETSNKSLIQDGSTRYLIRFNAVMFSTLLIGIPLYYLLIDHGTHDEIVLFSITTGLFLGVFMQLVADKIKNWLFPSKEV